MLPNTTSAIIQGPQSTALRQPIIYLAVPAQRKLPTSHVCSNPERTDCNTAIQVNGPMDSRTVQVCTCPPEVHKALLEGHLITQSRERSDTEVRPIPIQFGTQNPRALIPANATVQLATANTSRRLGFLTPVNPTNFTMVNENPTSNSTAVATVPVTLAMANAQTVGSAIRLPAAAHWILVPTSSLALATSGPSAFVGVNPTGLAISTTTSASTASMSSVGMTVTNSISSGSLPHTTSGTAVLAVTGEQKPPPDVLLTSTNAQTSADCIRTSPGIPDGRIRLTCMEGQLAHLSAWVQVLQQSPGAPVNAKQLAGYSHRNCANNTCRVSADGQSSADQESNYTPSNSSLDSAYSVRSATSSDSVSSRQQHSFDPNTHVQLSAAVPVLVTTANAPPHQGGQQTTHSANVSPPVLHVQCSSVHPNGAVTPFTRPNCNALVDHQHLQHNHSTATASTKRRANLQAVKSRLASTQSDLVRLRSELAGLRRTQHNCMAQHKEITDGAVERIKQMIAQVDGLELGLIQQARLTMNKQLDLYEQEASRARTWLKDLDSTIEDLRMVALTRGCRISVSEVEMLALHVNRISFRLRNFKNEIPKITDRLERVIEAEMRQINRNKQFIQNEFGRIEDALARCKQLTSTLFTLKRLGSVQQNSTNEHIPNMRTVREPTAAERSHLFERILAIQPDHEARLNSIQTFEDLRSFRTLILNPDVTKSFERELIFPDSLFTFPKDSSSSPEADQASDVGFFTGRNHALSASLRTSFIDQDSNSASNSLVRVNLTPADEVRDDNQNHRRVKIGPHAIRSGPVHSYKCTPFTRKLYVQTAELVSDEDHIEEYGNEDDDDVDGYVEKNQLPDGTYMGSRQTLDDPYGLKTSPHSQDDLVHAEPISITRDPLVSLASPPKSQLRDNSSSPQKETFRTAVQTATGAMAPTILKRVQSVLSSSGSSLTSASFGLTNTGSSPIACSNTSPSTTTTTGTKSSMTSARSAHSVPTRRTRVVFSRTVLVGNGSETIQLNCPSETDDEEDRRRQVFRPTGNFSVDDLVINRTTTTQPWIQAHKPDGPGTEERINTSRATKPRNRTVGRKLYRSINNEQMSHRNYPDRLANGLPVPVIKPVIASHPGQQHHHNCQAARQAMKTVSSGTDLSKRDTM
ncbi:hypothetical protein FGIG_00453 [Fasciola gigantica]|uniref:Actin interacting protein 3-like C-terminal domain-containing protein n=1 Tax=Fasciola gigantica TaxID=46835 RepID=A0A504Z0G0_FASGI|nr:hypothetical protein FGIG_00453 [Fasciola gigantica]